LSKYEWSKFIIFANTDLTVYSKNTLISSGARPFKEGMTLGFSLTVIVVYVIVLYVLANWIFARRDVQ
jgi:ABC-2 type transport system permease protein